MKRLALTSLSALLLAGCLSASDVPRLMHTAEKVTTASEKIVGRELSAEDEARIGAESAALLLGAAPLVNDLAAQRYVNRVGRWIASQTDTHGIEWRFGIIDSPAVNAFAAPAGYVLITRGLFARLDNESELAAVLGHEIAHVVRKHYVIAMSKKERSEGLSVLANAALEYRGGRSGQLTQVVNLARGVYVSGLDKDDEYEADRLGVTYAVRAGYEPFGLARVLSMYATHARDEGFGLLFSTHPSPESRLERLAVAMGDQLAPYEKTGLTDTREFSTHRTQLAGGGRSRGR